MFKFELSEENVALLKSLLTREIADTRVEIYHCRNASEFQSCLKAREAELHELLERLMRLLPA
ncbi:MAG TPA: hypothetical protein VIV61_02135 [Candidatus Ozemobacteraceae bacterium]